MPPAKKPSDCKVLYTPIAAPRDEEGAMRDTKLGCVASSTLKPQKKANNNHVKVLMVGALTSWSVVEALENAPLPGWVKLLISLDESDVAIRAIAQRLGRTEASRVKKLNDGTVAQFEGRVPGCSADQPFDVGGTKSIG